MRKFKTNGLRFYELCNQYLALLKEQKAQIESQLGHFNHKQVKEIRKYRREEDKRFQQTMNKLINEYKNDLALTGSTTKDDLRNWSNRDLSNRPQKELQKALDAWTKSVTQCLILT